MPARRASFVQADLTKVLKAHRDAGVAQPKIILEAARITIIPAGSEESKSAPNPWDQP
jgi:hypothetical protein